MGKTKRNGDIVKSYKKEINLNTKVVKSKKDYKRKNTHQGDYDDTDK